MRARSHVRLGRACELWYAGGVAIASCIRTTPPERVVCLYEQLLGPSFWSLPNALVEFHRRGGRAAGTLRVDRGSNPVARFLATRLGLPRAGDRVPVGLQVTPLAGGEHWVRRFDGVRFETRQRARNGLLEERVGWWRLIFRVTASPSGLRFQQVGMRVLDLPMPMVLAPRTTAAATPWEDGWWINVRLEAPLVGLICSYEGGLVPA
jgi:hypothetical protein